MSALLAYRGEESDTLYTWEPTTGRRFVTGAARIADIAFVGADAVVTDSGSDQVLLIRGVRDQAAPAVVADSNAVEDCSGVEFRDYVHLSQQPQIKWTYPPGVARLLHGNDGLRVAVHYMNATSSQLTGQVSVTLVYEDPTEAKFLAAPIFLNQPRCIRVNEPKIGGGMLSRM